MEQEVCQCSEVVGLFQKTLIDRNYTYYQMLTVRLGGGLGNQLFQLAGSSSVAKSIGYTFYLDNKPSPQTPHSDKNYFDNIFRNWKHLQRNVVGTPDIIGEVDYTINPWKEKIQDRPNVILDAWFQNYGYIEETFVGSLVLPETPILDGAFLHIRGGDFVNNIEHDIGLESYYERAVQHFPKDTMFYIFTNDIPYAKSKPILKNIRHEFVDEADELKALSLMRNCKLGGICANSTFSWWGAFLQAKNRILVVPSKWFRNPYIHLGGFFFPGSIVI